MGTNKLNRHIQNPLSSKKAVAVSNGVLILNSALLISALCLLGYYVVQANALVAFQYDIGAHESGIMELREKHHSVSARVAEQQHSDRVSEFALSSGMVLASDASYVSIPEAPLAGGQ